MADYVLVHGAWGGGACYDRLAAELETRGHRILVAELAGLGTRSAELHPSIDLSTHVRDVLDQVAGAGFDRFILVGHSYGGMVIAGVASHLGARIDAACYIDAFLPEDGQSLWDITGAFEHSWYIDSQKDTPGLVAPIGGIDLLDQPGVGRHPLLTLLEAVRFTGQERGIARRSYVFATGWQPTPFTRFRDRVASEPGWELHELGSGHMVMLDQPEALLEIVLALAA